MSPTWDSEREEWIWWASRRDFEYAMRQELKPEVRDLLDAATEVYCKLGPADRTPLAKKHYGTFERLRSALLALHDKGYVAEEWRLPEMDRGRG